MPTQEAHHWHHRPGAHHKTGAQKKILTHVAYVAGQSSQELYNVIYVSSGYISGVRD
jgi:hypothetical protein